MPRPLPLLFALACSAFALPAHAAVYADLNLDRLRTAPEAPAIQQRLDAILPAEARAKLATLSTLFGFDPRRDLHRVVVEIPDHGAPTIRLVGVPATRIAATLAMQGNGVSVLGGLTGYPLPQRPQAVFVAISETEALIGRGDLLALQKTAPAALPAVDAQLALSAHVTPAVHPHLPFMELVSTLDLRADGLGHVAVTVTAKDGGSASELERRLGVVRSMVQVGADGRLPEMERAKAVLAATTATRTDARLDLAIVIPAEVRAQSIERFLNRVEDHVHRTHP